jgi:ribosomal protein S18 acetylase RimI-like enzyme
MSQSSVREIPTTDAKGLKTFVALERRWVGTHPQYVSEIDADVIKGLSGQSAFFSDMEYVLLTASNGDRDVARCVALINRRYQNAKQVKRGFIGWFAALPGEDAAVRAMFERAEAWLRDRGVDHIVAPFNGAAALGIGVRSAAYDEDPIFPFFWQPPYYKAYLAGLGYEPSYPLWYYTVDFTSPAYQATKWRASEATGVVVRPIDKKRWDRELETFLGIFNETFKDEWEFHPMTLAEFHAFLDPMKPVLDPHQVLIGEVNGQTAGFCLGMPDWTPIFRSFKGKIGLPQVIRLMLTAGRYRRAGLLGIGVLPACRGTGLARALAVTLYRRYEGRGFRDAFYYPVNEENARSRKFAESMGGTGRVLAHCYDKRPG